MTREEAIECNKNLRMYMELSDKNNPYKFLEDNYIALDMAIKALEQQLCKDAISREMALDCDMSVRLNKSVLNQYPVGEYDYENLRRACFHGIELAKHEMEGYLIDLPSVTPQPNKDCISRQGVINAINQNCIFENEYNLTASRIKNAVEKLPPVKAQPKIGWWIIIDDCEQFIAKCSECGRIEDSRMISKYPYCHCGAKMGGIKEC